MKTINKYKTLLIILAVSLHTISANAQESELSAQAQVMSKQQFLEMYNNLLKQSGEYQKNAEQRNAQMMKQKLGEEEFVKYQADLEAMKAARTSEFAKCLGVSDKKVESFVDDLGTDFQLNTVSQCSSKLPENIKMTSLADIADNADLLDFSVCMEDLASNAIGIPKENLKKCSDLN